MTTWPILSVVTFLPLLGTLVIYISRGDDEAARRNSRWIALWTTVVTFAVSLILVWRYDAAQPDFQFVEKANWLASAITYHMGVDGISLPFLILTTTLMPLCIIASWKSITMRVREYMMAFLLLETLMIGTFSALDLMLFYLFFEGGLIPMFLIIGVWGGPRRVYASFKFFLYTFLGSVLMLLAIMALYWNAGTTDIPTLMHTAVPRSLQTWAWLAFFASFAVKMPMWPVHTWLPDAHVEAPTAGSVILAAILLKMGGYGFLRLSLPMFPLASHGFAPLIFSLSAIAIIYTSLVALMQEDIKKLIAYSSVAHMGFVTMGIFAGTTQGVAGGVFQMISHGIVSGALFLCVGIVYDRLHTREIAAYGGLVNRMPLYALVFMVFTMANVGLPGTSGFVGEFMTLIGTFKVSLPTAFFATTGVILSAAYALWLYRKVVFGALTKPSLAGIKDLTFRESLTLFPLVALTILFGFYPKPVLDMSAASVQQLVNNYNTAVTAVKAAALINKHSVFKRSGTRFASRKRVKDNGAMSFSSAGYQLQPVLPELVLAFGAMVLLMVGAYRGQGTTRLVTALAVCLLVLVGALELMLPAGKLTTFGGSFIVDDFARFLKILALIGSGATLILATEFLSDPSRRIFEFAILVLLSTLGMMVLISAGDLIMLYLGLELMSLALYVVAASNRDNAKSTEAGLKYFVLGALSSGMLLYGASLIYGFTGTVSFAGIAAAATTGSVGIVFGIVFLLAGLCFKVSAVPFHMWTPDVYEGAPTPVTAFFASAPKVAAMAVFTRVALTAFPGIVSQWQQIVVFVAIASMVLGSFAAIGQSNIKRLMAYSSIGHMGFALVGLASGTVEGAQGVLVYIAIYVAMTLGSFAVILTMKRNGQAVEQISDFAGLSRTNPLVAFFFMMLLFSLAGVPPLAGFFAKWYVFVAAINAKLFALAVIGVLTSVVGAFYYLNIVKTMYFDEPLPALDPMRIELRVVLAVAGLFNIFFAILPGPLVSVATAAAKSLF